MECAKRVALPQGLEGYTTRYMLRDPHPLRFSNNGESDTNHTTTVDREHTKLKSSKPRQRQLNYSVLPIPIDSHFLIPHRGELGPFFGDHGKKRVLCVLKKGLRFATATYGTLSQNGYGGQRFRSTTCSGVAATVLCVLKKGLRFATATYLEPQQVAVIKN